MGFEAIAALGFAAVSVGLSIKLYIDRGARAAADMRALEANSRAAAAESQNSDLADQLKRADSSRAALLNNLDTSRAETDHYRRLYVTALSKTPGGAGALAVELGGGLPPNVSAPGSAEDRGDGEGEAVPTEASDRAATVPSRPPR